MQTLDKKRFVLYFKPEFPGGERVQIVEMDFFTEERGFRSSEIGDISRLEKPESVNIGSLMVWRVK